MIEFFKRLFHSKKNLILAQILTTNQRILAELIAIRGDGKNKEASVYEKVSDMTGEVAKLTKMMYDMVESLSKYFNLEVEFMKKEKEKAEKIPTEHDHRF